MEVLFGVFAALAFIAALRLVYATNSVQTTLAPLIVLLLVGLLFVILSHEFTDTISALHAPQVVFYMVGGLALAGGMGVVFANDLVHAALFLIMTLLMTAGVFVLVSAEFLGLVQILLYGGAVSILIIFALMLTRARETQALRLNGPQWPFALVTGGGLGAVLILMVARVDTWKGLTDTTYKTINDIGNALFDTYALPFEIASLVLIVALVGAIVIARAEETPELPAGQAEQR
ncbi:MAG TPA: NADH-quinone oxidoreductase subunit J [Dehalococcoidia bacterium]|nr:NADH-quinone oxidoreductase subunit J [Dehalococcoidia bacterium]